MENLNSFSAFNSMPHPIEIYDLSGSLVWKNKAAACFSQPLDLPKTFGFSEGEILIHLKEKPLEGLVRERTLEGQWEGRQDPIHEVRPFILDGHQDLLGVSFREVSKEQELSRIIKDLEFFFEKAEEVGCLGSWVSDLAPGDNLKWSKNTYRIFECEVQDFKNSVEDFFNKVHPDDREQVRLAAQKAIESGRSYSVDHRIVTPKGHTKWVRESGVVVHEDGRVPRFIGVCQDITERVLAQDKLKTLNERFRALFDSNLIGVFITSADGQISDGNSEYLRMTGYTEEDVRKGLVSWRKMTPVEYEDNDKIQLELLNKNGKCSAFEKEYIRKDGKRFPVLLAAVRTQGLVHGQNEIVALAYDLTEVKTLQRKFQQMQKLDALGRLAGGVAHDFNNILSIIMLYLEQLLGGTLDIHQRQKLKAIETHSLRARSLIEQLLSFSSNKMLNATPVSLGATIINMRDVVERLLDENIKLTIIDKSGGALMNGRVTQLEQIIMNLTTNAKDAMPRGGSFEIVTEVISRESNAGVSYPWLGLFVTDTGVGMNPSILEKIYEPFFSTKEEGGGTGLGLATVYGIVKQFGGQIEVVSEPGKGTTFRIFFPVFIASSQETGLQAQTLERAEKESILVVEDQEELRELVVSLLESHHYKVYCAESGTIAVCQFTKVDLNLIITDVIMPGMSGPDFIKLFKKEIPVIYMSGFVNPEITLSHPIDGDAYFLAKPFNSKELLEKVQHALARSSIEKVDGNIDLGKKASMHGTSISDSL